MEIYLSNYAKITEDPQVRNSLANFAKNFVLFAVVSFYRKERQEKKRKEHKDFNIGKV